MSMSAPKVTRSFAAFSVTIEVTDHRHSRALINMADDCLSHYHSLLKAYGDDPPDPSRKDALRDAYQTWQVAHAIMEEITR